MYFSLADSGKLGTHIYHKANLVLGVLAPVAFLFSPSPVNMPIDIILGFLIPYHSHVAINAIISDYVPAALKSVSRSGALGLALATTLGLLKLNLTGPGLTDVVKNLWRRPSN